MGSTAVANDVTWLYRCVITFCATATTESGDTLPGAASGTRALLVAVVLVVDDAVDERVAICACTLSSGSIDMPKVAVMAVAEGLAAGASMDMSFPEVPWNGEWDRELATPVFRRKMALAFSLDNIPSSCHVLLGQSKWTVAA